jgi:hypothetical protein
LTHCRPAWICKSFNQPDLGEHGASIEWASGRGDHGHPQAFTRGSRKAGVLGQALDVRVFISITFSVQIVGSGREFARWFFFCC